MLLQVKVGSDCITEGWHAVASPITASHQADSVSPSIANGAQFVSHLSSVFNSVFHGTMVRTDSRLVTTVLPIERNNKLLWPLHGIIPLTMTCTLTRN
jgi:hypothetical protein